MSKQTAVDKFHDGIIDLLRNASVNTNTVAIIWIECKAMEREQIEEAYIDSEARYHLMNDAKAMAKHYYEQTYGKEATDAN